ncbi:hypothetical protein Clacol_008075 [Clathrus columnatus]|uniref:Uncharacterized protein n=1 Tax=Clathrus columnatus TaxID=1419009 RepID=A0AAV5AK02_9AGAM|nr:hypothetical protein Clacol_008075 [Clathrus columnatus]
MHHAFLLQSNYLLRIYVTLLVAPSIDPSLQVEPEQFTGSHDVDTQTVSIQSSTSGSKWRIISTSFVFLIFSILQWNTIVENLSLYFEVPPQTIHTISQHLIYAILFLSVALITQIIHPGKVIAHTTSNGRYITIKWEGFTTDQEGFLTTLLISSITSFAFVMVTGLSDPDNSLPIVVVTMTYVSTIQLVGRVPLRPLTIIYTLFMFIIHALLIFIRYSDSSSFRLEEEGGLLWTTSVFKGLDYVPFLPATVGSLFTGPLIASMLRFDFNTYLNTLGSPTYLGASIPLPADKSTLAGQSILGAPQSLLVPDMIPKPYYTLTLITWSLIRITTLVLCLTLGLPLKSPYDACALALFWEFPIMTIVLLLFAIMRGEARILWNFNEAWSQPSNSIVTTDQLLPVSVKKMTLQEGSTTWCNSV